jgi:ABC-type antimicrobial peptide transport system permease subunit
VLGYIALFVLTGLLAGFYPSVVLSRFNPVETLYGRLKLTNKNYLSKGLVIFQFTLSTFLIIATFIIYSQFNYLTHFDLGYNDKNVAVVNSGFISREKLEVVKNDLLKNSSIQNISADMGGRWGTRAHVNGATDIEFDIRIIDENYFSLFQIPVIHGRSFSKNISTDTSQAVVVNETFVKTAGWKNPIGQVVDFYYDNKKYNVIGVIKDYHFAALNEKMGPEIFLTRPQQQLRDVFIKLKPGGTAETLHFIEATFKKLFPYQPYQSNFKEEENALQYESEAKWKQIISFGALLTIFISCIGLFGLATLAAEKRTKEIGIRKVLGASVPVIVRKLSKDFLKLVILAAMIAAPLAWLAMNKWLENYPYRIAINPWTFGFAAMLVTMIALLTISYQFIKSALANPVKSLRTE